MRGAIKERNKGSYTLIYDTGYTTDPETGKRKRKQVWETWHPVPGTPKREARKQAEAKLRERIGTVDKGTYAEPSTITVLAYLQQWMDTCVKPPMRAKATQHLYDGIIRNHVAVSAIAHIKLQKLRGSDIERYYAERREALVTETFLTVHHAMLSGAFKKATRDHLLERNPITDVEAKPRVRPNHDTLKTHVWSADEAVAFLATAKQAEPQTAAFFALALDSGARKGELHGLRWSDVDLDAGQLRIERQLRTHGADPTFGPTKTEHGRTVALGSETVALLRDHRRTQNELMMRNRATYKERGLVFACAVRVRGHELGDALEPRVLAATTFRALIREAGIRRIKFHGLRHTSATLLLRAGVPAHVVSRRLGHADVATTLETYAHVLPDMSADAAAKLAAVLHVS